MFQVFKHMEGEGSSCPRVSEGGRGTADLGPSSSVASIIHPTWVTWCGADIGCAEAAARAS